MRLLIVSDWGPWAGAEQSQIMRPEETGRKCVQKKVTLTLRQTADGVAFWVSACVHVRRESWSRRHGRSVPGRQCHMAHVSPFWNPLKPKAPGTAEISAD